MWVSQIPTKMFDSWVNRKLIKKNAWDFVEVDGTACNRYHDVMAKDGCKGWKEAYNKNELQDLRDKGWKVVYHRFGVSRDTMLTLQLEAGEWYSSVFLYVENWLKKNGFIELKSGSFSGGFCATDSPDRTTEIWGAPLAGKKNKVAQIKEKFGRITVYFDVLDPKERAKVEKFEKHVQEKFDCSTSFI